MHRGEQGRQERKWKINTGIGCLPQCMPMITQKASTGTAQGAGGERELPLCPFSKPGSRRRGATSKQQASWHERHSLKARIQGFGYAQCCMCPHGLAPIGAHHIVLPDETVWTEHRWPRAGHAILRRAAPIKKVPRPTKAVEMARVRREVPRASALDLSLSRQMVAMEEAMADRKMSPTSWTWPTAKGSVLFRVNTSWWMALANKASLAIGSRKDWYAGACRTHIGHNRQPRASS